MWLTRPEGYSNMDLLGLCAGYEVNAQDNNRWVVVHQEHRMVVPAIWASRTDGPLSTPPLLLRLDAHEDFEEEHRDYRADREHLRNIEDCLLFANSLPADDGGWVEAPVMMGWVDDVLTLGVQDSHEPMRRVTDVDGRVHVVANVPWDLSCGPDDNVSAVLRRFAGRLARRSDEHAGDSPIWLDIDLDFAVAILAEGRLRVRGGCEMGRWFDTPLAALGGPDGMDLGSLVERAISVATLVTIATEPSFCGGHAAVSQVVEVLEQLLSNDGNIFRCARLE